MKKKEKSLLSSLETAIFKLSLPPVTIDRKFQDPLPGFEAKLV